MGYSVTVNIYSFEGADDPNFELGEFDKDNFPAEVIIPTVDKYSSVCFAMWANMRDLGNTPIDLDLVKMTLPCEGFNRFLVLTDNYHDDSSLTEEKLGELQKILGRDDAPKWYSWTYFQCNCDPAGGQP